MHQQLNSSMFALMVHQASNLYCLALLGGSWIDAFFTLCIRHRIVILCTYGAPSDDSVIVYTFGCIKRLVDVGDGHLSCCGTHRAPPRVMNMLWCVFFIYQGMVLFFVLWSVAACQGPLGCGVSSQYFCLQLCTYTYYPLIHVSTYPLATVLWSGSARIPSPGHQKQAPQP
jgi:hypothetical protein